MYFLCMVAQKTYFRYIFKHWHLLFYMKKLIALVFLVFLIGCNAKYNAFQEGSLSAQYPNWNPISGTDKIDVKKGSCEVKIGIHADRFNPANLKITTEISIIPALKRAGLFIENYDLADNEAVLELTANNVYGKQKYIACDNKLYRISAACTKKNEVIDNVINSAKCSISS